MLKQRNGIWQLHIPVRGKKPIRETTGIRVEGKTPPPEAQELHDKIANEVWRTGRLGEKPRKRWEDAVITYLEHARKRSLGDDKEMLAWLDPHLRGEFLEEIAGLGEDGLSARWDAVLAEKRKQHLEETGRAISDSRLNRYRSLVAKIIGDNGLSAKKLRKYKEPKPGKLFLTYELAMETLPKAPAWAQDPLLFDWAVGLRKGNLIGLEWAWIDLQRKVLKPNPELFKNGEAPELPLSSFAIAILRRQLGKHQKYVFVRDGEPITDGAWRCMWDKIRPDVNGKSITFHSAGRKTWASWLRQGGVSCEDIKDAGGWKTLAVVVDTYAHITPDNLRPHVEQLSEKLHVLDTLQRTKVA